MNRPGPAPWPFRSPKGRGVLFTAWFGTIESMRIAVVSLGDRYSHAARAQWSVAKIFADRTSRVCSRRQSACCRLRRCRVEPDGEPVTVLENVFLSTNGALFLRLPRTARWSTTPRRRPPSASPWHWLTLLVRPSRWEFLEIATNTLVSHMTVGGLRTAPSTPRARLTSLLSRSGAAPHRRG